jgi:hypothetical protein
MISRAISVIGMPERTAPPGPSQASLSLLAPWAAAAELEAAPLEGGGNNRLYRVRTGSRELVIKEYFQNPGDLRDRLGTEFAFARFAWEQGIRNIPEPLCCDGEAHTAVYSCVEGLRPAPGELSASDLEQALAFIAGLNEHRDSPSALCLTLASEACFSLRQHLDLVAQRIGKLRSLSPDTDRAEQVLELVERSLLPLHGELNERILSAALGPVLALEPELPQDERILSPSDFGFHNALRRADGSLVFLDFEYAGWDDPAKLIADFFNQIAVPAPPEWLPRFTDRVAELVANPEALRSRTRLLLPLYGLKWCCIVLNSFLPIEARRRQFARGVDSENLAEQLEKAERQLARTRIFFNASLQEN